MAVVELGGRVVAYRSDTLVLEPYYLTTAADGAERITVYRGGRAGFPDAALVAIDGAVDIGDFHSPHRPRSPEQIVAVVLGTGMMLTLLYADVVMLLHL
jgi:hypothetical protein